MSDYIYKNPIDNGYTQFKLSKKQHNQLFEYRQIKWYDRYEYYYNDKLVEIHKFCNNAFIIVSTLLFPFAVLFYGIGNIKKCWHDFKELYHQKRTGSFSSDNINYKSEKYKKIMEIING